MLVSISLKHLILDGIAVIRGDMIRNNMETEYEVKVLGISLQKVIETIDKLKFSDPKKLNFRRYIYDVNSNKDTWLRLRTDNKKTTLTYKNFVQNAVDGMQELEITVDDFEKTHELLMSLGLKYITYQENRRSVYKNDEIELAIDEWPLINPYLEIEGKSKEVVEKYIKLLNLTDYKKTSEPTSYVYKMQGLNIEDYKNLTF